MSCAARTRAIPVSCSPALDCEPPVCSRCTRTTSVSGSAEVLEHARAGREGRARERRRHAGGVRPRRAPDLRGHRRRAQGHDRAGTIGGGECSRGRRARDRHAGDSKASCRDEGPSAPSVSARSRAATHPSVIYESPQRIASTLRDLAALCGGDRMVAVCRRADEAVTRRPGAGPSPRRASTSRGGRGPRRARPRRGGGAGRAERRRRARTEVQSAVASRHGRRRQPPAGRSRGGRRVSACRRGSRTRLRSLAAASSFESVPTASS